MAQLADLPRPSVQLPRAQRVAPYELSTYRVIAAIRAVLPPEGDGDLHVILEDLEDSTQTLVAEVPDSACALGSAYAGAFANTYRALSSAPPKAIVVIDGIGFFDFMHGQIDVAPNGFELHPIVGVRIVGQQLAHAAGPILRRAGPRPDTLSGSSTQVWVNTSSNVYHCPGTRWYGATKRGAYMTEAQAIRAGARPAYGRRCS